MPAGTAALIVGLQPILTAILAQYLLREQVNLVQWAGLLLGLLGVALVVGENALRAGMVDLKPSAYLAIGLALLCTTIGTLYHKRFATQMPLVGGTLVQFIAATAALLSLALLFGETMQIEWTLHFTLALWWGVVVLSIGAILLLMYLIRHNSASSVASLFYLVPPVTAVQAYFLFGEQLGALAILGMALAAVGVAMVVRR
jgi:drug/metabolite transporter (DMT)-like permease